MMHTDAKSVSHSDLSSKACFYRVIIMARDTYNISIACSFQLGGSDTLQFIEISRLKEASNRTSEYEH